MDCVYICRVGENEELLYSIRSVEKNLPDSNIWVIGGKPNWYIGNYINVADEGGKFQNINKCYKAIIDEEKISEDFILMNDDFFILSPSNNYKYYSGYLKDKIINHIEINGISSYSRALRTAVEALKRQGINEPLNYDIHTPMAFNKAKLAQVIDLSLAPRSMYGNVFIKDGLNIDDVKVYSYTKKIQLDGNFISTEDDSFLLIKDKIVDIFPNPSKFER